MERQVPGSGWRWLLIGEARSGCWEGPGHMVGSGRGKFGERERDGSGLGLTGLGQQDSLEEEREVLDV